MGASRRERRPPTQKRALAALPTRMHPRSGRARAGDRRLRANLPALPSAKEFYFSKLFGLPPFTPGRIVASAFDLSLRARRGRAVWYVMASCFGKQMVAVGLFKLTFTSKYALSLSLFAPLLLCCTALRSFEQRGASSLQCVCHALVVLASRLAFGSAERGAGAAISVRDVASTQSRVQRMMGTWACPPQCKFGGIG